jgi:hypothetical protein
MRVGCNVSVRLISASCHNLGKTCVVGQRRLTATVVSVLTTMPRTEEPPPKVKGLLPRPAVKVSVTLHLLLCLACRETERESWLLSAGHPCWEALAGEHWRVGLACRGKT